MSVAVSTLDMSIQSNDSEAFSAQSSKISKSKSEKGEKKKKKKKDKDKEKSSRKSKHQNSPEKEEGFGDAFFTRNSNNPEDWAAFNQEDSGWDSPPNPGSGNQVSQVTTGTAAMTVSTQGSEKGLPFNTIEVDTNQGQSQQPYLVPSQDDAGAVAQFHSEMFQGFLKRNGHDATMAVATAAAFENFLKQQHNVMDQLQHGGDGADGFDFEDTEENRLDAMESVIDDCMADSFAPDSIWDDGSAIGGEKAAMMAQYMQQSEPNRKKKAPPPPAGPGFDEKALMMAEYMRQSEPEQAPPPPKKPAFDEKALMMAEYMQAEPQNFEEDEQAELAAYHGEMLQGFLQRHGKGDDTALQTASAFQDFLKRQQDALGKLSTPSGSVCSGSSPGGSRGEVSRGAYSESAATNVFRVQKQQAGVPVFIGGGPNGFGNTKRNESFVRNKSGISVQSEGSAGLKTRNHVAARMLSQKNGQQQGGPPDNRKIAPLGAPVPERPVRQQMEELTIAQIACVELIRKQSKGTFNDALCLRFARCYDFKAKAALKVFKKFNKAHLAISIANMESLLRTRLVYPLPGVIGRGGINMFYLQFRRLIPRKTNVSSFADLLIYVMNCMHEKESACVNGIGLIADLTDFSMSNFSIPYMSKFLMLVQGRQFPVKVECVLFVNAPKWFGTVWGIMKQMMSSDFLKTKVHRISFNDMVRSHLQRGCEAYLTSDVFLGRRNADRIVGEFIEERKALESKRILAGSGQR